MQYMTLVPTRILTEVERLYGQVDTGCLWDMYAILEGNNHSIFLHIKTAFHKCVMPVLVKYIEQGIADIVNLF